MDETALIRVTDSFAIPRSELLMRVSRSSGAGGQHVNKTSSRVEVLWSPLTSSAGTEEERARIAAALAKRMNAEGSISVVSSETRSQLRNRGIAEERLAAIVAKALAVPKKRRPTKPSRAAREERLSEKKRRSRKKKDRSDNLFD